MVSCIPYPPFFFQESGGGFFLEEMKVSEAKLIPHVVFLLLSVSIKAQVNPGTLMFFGKTAFNEEAFI